MLVYTAYQSYTAFAQPLALVSTLCPDAIHVGCADAPDILHHAMTRFTRGNNALRHDDGYRATIQKTSYAIGCVWLCISAAAVSLLAQPRLQRFWSHVGTVSLLVIPVWLHAIAVMLQYATDTDADYFANSNDTALSSATFQQLAVTAGVLTVLVLVLGCTLPSMDTTDARDTPNISDEHSAPAGLHQYVSAWLLAMLFALWWAMEDFALVRTPYEWSDESLARDVRHFTNTELRPPFAHLVLGVTVGYVLLLLGSRTQVPPARMLTWSVGGSAAVLLVSVLVVMQCDWMQPSVRMTRAMSCVSIVGAVVGLCLTCGVCAPHGLTRKKPTTNDAITEVYEV